MQVRNIYVEGKAVFAKSEGNGQEKFYVEGAADGVYTLRKDEAKGQGVLRDKVFAEEDLNEIPWERDS